MAERDKIILACAECFRHNYTLSKNKRLQPKRVEYRKFCPRCGRHTLHKETR